jgi:hypothetical protein
VVLGCLLFVKWWARRICGSFQLCSKRFSLKVDTELCTDGCLCVVFGSGVRRVHMYTRVQLCVVRCVQLCVVRSCALCTVVRCAQLCVVRSCALCTVVRCAQLCTVVRCVQLCVVHRCASCAAVCCAQSRVSWGGNIVVAVVAAPLRLRTCVAYVSPRTYVRHVRATFFSP